MKFLVLGGAGYIGSHFVREALSSGHECLIYDNLSTGHRKSIPSGVTLIEASILDLEKLKSTLVAFKPDTVLHYAALALVGESVQHPSKYYENNVIGVANLLNAMMTMKKKPNLIFSSSCAVFGNPVKVPVAEDDAKAPISPYGRTKLVAEFMIEDYAHAYGFKAVALRYFNACGAIKTGEIGEDHVPETHLIPNVIHSVLNNKQLSVFGDNYPTKDGTCVRDYIHVSDLAISHIQAAEYLATDAANTFTALHLGTGSGSTNLEIIEKVSELTSKKVDYKIIAPREGDASALFADNNKAKKLISFAPRHSSLDNIVTTALTWHKGHPQGYKK